MAAVQGGFEGAELVVEDALETDVLRDVWL